MDPCTQTLLGATVASSFSKKDDLKKASLFGAIGGIIPDFDVLCAGFPCQPFSQAGHKKGFKDNKDGNLFFSIEEILKIKKPKVFFLEND